MDRSKESQYEKQLNAKIEDRISKMENKEYVFAKRFSKIDYLIVLIVVILCLVFLVVGAYI